MNVTEKLIILNKAAEQLRLAMQSILDVYKDDPYITYYVWKINKNVSLMHQAIFSSVEKESTEEDFKKIIKQLEKDFGG